MVDRATVQAWLDRYVEAWRTYDPRQIGSLFSADARYHYNPYDDPVEGREAIVASWLENPDTPGSYEAAYHPVLIEGERAVTNGRSRYFEQDGRTVHAEYDNIFLLTFNEAGECTEFREWWMRRRSG